MLVSAAMDPYRKFAGNAASNSAMLPGTRLRLRNTASPRNTCVPGVHAHSGAGVSTIASTSTIAHRRARLRRSCLVVEIEIGVIQELVVDLVSVVATGGGP